MSDIRDGHYRLGIAYLNAEAYAEAIPHFQAVLDVDPTFIDAYHGLALAYFGEHRLQDARNAAREALKIDANYQPVLSFLQTVEPRPPQPTGISVAPAVQIEKKEEPQPPVAASRVRPSADVSVMPAEEPIEKEKPRPAVDEIDIDKEMERALVYLGNKQYPQAEAALKKVIKAEPQNSLAHYHLAQTYMETGALHDAQSQVDEVLRLTPQYQPARDLKNAITFLAKRERQRRFQKKLIKFLAPLAVLVVGVFIASQLGFLRGILPQKRPPALWIDTTLEDPANNNGYIDAGEHVRLKVTISNSGGAAKGLKVVLLPQTIDGLRYQMPEIPVNIAAKGFQTIRIPIAADKKVRERRVSLKVEVVNRSQMALATTSVYLSIKR